MALLTRLFGEGFRVFFLAAGVFALLAIGLWTLWLTARIDLPTAAPAIQWHAHEMIFGYGGATLAGFFLTAVPNWTGAKAARHIFITAAALIWLAGRIAVLWSGVLPAVLVAGIDLAFLPVLCAKIATQLIRRPKPQNLMFLGLLMILLTANLFVHLEWAGFTADTASRGLYAGLYGLVAMIAVLGGRITPAFTRNAMTRAGRTSGLPRSFGPLDGLGVAAAIALPLATLAHLPAPMVGAIALLAGTVQISRLAFWRTRFTLGQPILWSLHLSFGLIGLGLVLTGLAAFGLGTAIAALHLTAIGGVGGMTLAVMSRASLGHTGRPLVAPIPVALAYVLLPLAAAFRWAASTWPGLYLPATLTAGLLWLLAFTLYLVAFWPVFLGPRLTQSAE